MERQFLITDVGSTTTKAILIAPKDGKFRLIGTGKSPTTVESPYEDVTIGVLKSLEDLGKNVGQILVGENLPDKGSSRSYFSTSSAGGGLQVLVSGVMKKVTAESARRAALGAGAVIVDVITVDDDRPSFEKIDAIRRARPDMILIAGGFEGGNIQFVLEVSDLLTAADLKPRFGETYRVPVIYAGNSKGQELVEDTLKGKFDVRLADNIRPSGDKEVVEPVRAIMHELFLSHVMKQAPGYVRLIEWVDGPILPTPMAVGKILKSLAERRKTNVLACDIGGATTDIFSVIDNELYRSVSANLGMSYSSANVLLEAGPENVCRWLPLEVTPERLSDRIGQKLLNPTRVPHTLADLVAEQALAREALRLSMEHHKDIARTLPKDVGIIQQMTMSQLASLKKALDTETVIDVANIGVIIGSGGVISNAPRRNQAALMMMDAFQPELITELYVDSVFMMPHLGVLLDAEPEIAMDVLEKDCLIPIGPCIAPRGSITKGKTAVTVEIGSDHKIEVPGGDIRVIPTKSEKPVKVRAVPAAGLNLGEGPGAAVVFETKGGVLGIVIDARGRPIILPEDPAEQAEANARWAVQTGAYTLDELNSLKGGLDL